jgi:Domain of Unknown Function (DUF1206)
MSTPTDPSVAVRRARSAGDGFVNSTLFAVLSRGGFVARALIYGIIGLLALELALGRGGKITNQQGALQSVAQHRFGHLLLALLAVGLGGYSLWRLFRAILGHGREGSDKGIERLGALGSGIVYGAFCVFAVQILTGPGTAGQGGAKKTTNDVFGWPAGRWIVGVAGLVMLGVAAYQFLRGVRKKFLDDSKTGGMPRPVFKWFSTFGTIGHVARAVVFGLVGVFLVKAAYDFKASEAIGLDGALGKLYNGSHGSWLMGALAAGLVAFAAFSLVEAKYRRI